MDFLSSLKKKFGSGTEGEEVNEEGYVELATSEEDIKSKIEVRPFVIQDFEHIKPILDSLRESKTIALINIKPLKDRDLVELKRAINKIKKTVEAIDGDIAGFGEDWIAATPSFAHIHRAVKEEPKQEQTADVSEVTEFSD